MHSNHNTSKVPSNGLLNLLHTTRHPESSLSRTSEQTLQCQVPHSTLRLFMRSRALHSKQLFSHFLCIHSRISYVRTVHEIRLIIHDSCYLEKVGKMMLTSGCRSGIAHVSHSNTYAHKSLHQGLDSSCITLKQLRAKILCLAEHLISQIIAAPLEA